MNQSRRPSIRPSDKSELYKRLVEAVVYRFGESSRVDIHKVTNLRPSTITVLVRELLKEKRLIEVGPGLNRIGRKRVLLRLNERYRFILGIEFDDETVVTGIMNLRPEVTHMVCEETCLAGGVEGLIKQLKSCSNRVMRKAGIKSRSLLGIGIADPGLVDSRRGLTLISSTIDFWKQVPLKRVFEQEFKVPTLVESRTRAKAWAERTLGAGKMSNNMVYVDYGSGIGAGIIVDGKLLYGRDCAVGEFGHTRIMEGGPACKCGSIGCLEAVAGADALRSRIRRVVEEGASPGIRAASDVDSATTTAWTVLEAAKSGDKICRNIVADMARHLGLGIANLVNLFNPSVVVLDKRLDLAGEAFLEQIVRIIGRQSLSSSSDGMTVKFGRLDSKAGVLGIGLGILDRHYRIPSFIVPRFMTRPRRNPDGHQGDSSDIPAHTS